jgi:autophagy-related protein 2
LADLPLPFMLESGTIGNVSARIPWPNLTAPLALSLSSLSLTFVHAPRVNSSSHPRKDDLAESVGSMAESFVHDELSTRESEVLRESFNIGLPSRHQPPGSIDPFLSTVDLDSQSYVREYDQGDEANDDADPSTQGVSLIATIIERLLSRFEFDASDLTIRLVLPRKAEFTLRLRAINYSTESMLDSSGTLPDRGADDGEVRIAKISGVTIFTRDIQALSTPLSTASRRRSVSPYNSSSSSEENDEAMMMMSQSLASLPLPPPVRSISPESSMYHSATSSVRGSSPDTDLQMEDVGSVEEKILSLGQGDDSIMVRLVTPRLTAPHRQAESDTGGRNTGTRVRPHSENRIRLSVTIGTVAVALSPIHARSLLYLSSAFTSLKSAGESPNIPHDPPADSLDVTFHLKGITFLLLRSPSHILTSQVATNDTLHNFFLARPSLSTPHIPHLRAQFDALDLSFTTVPSSEITSHTRQATDPAFSTASDTNKQLVKASLADISIFAVSASPNRGWIVSPVLVSDPNLTSQYDPDTKYPSFDVVDWTKTGHSSTSGKVSQWRVRQTHGRQKSSATRSSKIPHLPALQARFEPATTGKHPDCEINIVPLHLFLDLGILEGAIDFITSAAPPTFSEEDVHAEHGPDADETPPATPRARGFAECQEDNSEKERRRLEALIINDFATYEETRPSGSVSYALFFSRPATLHVH